MQVWRGWTEAAAAATKRAPTWAEWCATQRTQHEEQCSEVPRPDGGLLSERERARLGFVRWLYHTDRLGPPGDDQV